MTGKREEYVPPDPTSIEVNEPDALRFWARTLETPEDKLLQAVRKAGPMIDAVKKELGIAGV